MKKFLGLVVLLGSMGALAQHGSSGSPQYRGGGSYRGPSPYRGVEDEIRRIDMAATWLSEAETSLYRDFPRSRVAQAAIAELAQARNSIAVARDYLTRGQLGQTILLTARGQGFSNRNDLQEACTRARNEGENEVRRLCSARNGYVERVTFTNRIVQNPPNSAVVCTLTANAECSL